MKASFTARITCSALAATLAVLPCNEALAQAAPTAAPASTPPAAPAPTATPGTTPPADPNQPAGAVPTADTPPEATGETAEAPVETPVETPAEAPAAAEAPPPPPAPEGPVRPPEPTVANGKYKAKGTGLMIAGGALLGLGVAGVVTSFFLTKCPEPADSFACKNQQHNTFAVPATGAAALLGAVLLAVGVGYRLRYKKWERWTPDSAPKTALYPTMLRGGAGVGYTVKF
jgi:hypothetical protein